MNVPETKPRIAVVSPFLDKRHGTERCIAEQIERLADEFEFHVYSTRIANINKGKIVWHRIPQIPGPHIAKYCWFFLANHIWRWFNHTLRRLGPRFTYSPGINCFDADAIAVHVIFANVHESVRDMLSLRKNAPRCWPRLLHRRLSYWFFVFLERRVYTRHDLPLIAVSSKVRDDLKRIYRRDRGVLTILNGMDPSTFNPAVRDRLRVEARNALGYSSADFVVLLVGNDWNNKGLRCLLEAVRRISDPRIQIAAVGTDDATPYLPNHEPRASQTRFFPLRQDPEFYYAAADVYAGPSLEDAFGLPPLEAMACGLPAIVSRCSGVSEIVRDHENGLILNNPESASELATLIRELYMDESLRLRLGTKAAETARNFTWQRNAEHLRAFFRQLLAEQQVQSVPARDPL